MKVLGINDSHNATAVLLQDGEVRSCVSEERIVRKKNVSGFPYGSVEYLLTDAELSAGDIDRVVIGYNNPVTFLNTDGAKEHPALNALGHFAKKYGDILKSRMNLARAAYNALYAVHKKLNYPRLQARQRHQISTRCGFPEERIQRIDHHLAHALAAYYSASRTDSEEWIAITLDGFGDGFSGKVFVVRDNRFVEITATPDRASIGLLYTNITHVMGMKMLEHEYKIMGLAPYAGPYETAKAYERLKPLISFNPESLSFEAPREIVSTYHSLPETLKGCRFDGIAGAVQQLTEELMVQYITAVIKKTGVTNIALGGGVFMNVKANMLIREIPEVGKLFIMPSAGDESTAFGAAYYGHLFDTDGMLKPDACVKPLKHLYLGHSFDDQNIRQAFEEFKGKSKLSIAKQESIEHATAQLLADGKIVAWFQGSMEFGARALGARSILADPRNPDVIPEINHQIKNRDFWMPFAASIKEERACDYILNPKNQPAPFMIITFRSTELGQKHLRCGMHPFDKTIRPQLVSAEANPKYHRMISEFETLTGVGGVLNTSFNLHGEPIVCTPADALDVMDRSGLSFLAIGSYLVTKES